MPRILLVEDDPDVRGLLRDALEDAGFEVTPSGDGPEAIRALSQPVAFDLLLLDDELPGQTGRQLLAQLRSRGLDTTAVFCSGSLVLSPEERSRLGVHSVVRKPAARRELIEAVRRAIGDPPA